MKWLIAVSTLTIALTILMLVVHNLNIVDDGLASKKHVAVLMLGSRKNNSWNESHYVAMAKTAKELKLRVSYYENVLADSSAMNVIEKAIGSGARIIVASSSDFEEVANRVARKHPEIFFFLAMGSNRAPNMSTYYGRIYQMRYLLGMVAGLMTKTNEIGFVASYNMPGVNRGINAFALGVAKVNPNAKVYVSWSSSWIDEAMSEVATRELLDSRKIDVIAVHTDAVSPYLVANEKNVWVVGNNGDMSDLCPNLFLTAPVWHWEKFYTPKIKEILHDQFESRHYWMGAESGLIDLAPLRNVSDSILSIVEREKQRFINENDDIFQGPLFDNKGVLRVEKGESMTNEDLLHHFDWYVQGVVDGINN